MTKHFEPEDEVLIKGTVRDTVMIDQKEEPESYFVKVGHQMLMITPEHLTTAGDIIQEHSILENDE